MNGDIIAGYKGNVFIIQPGSLQRLQVGFLRKEEDTRAGRNHVQQQQSDGQAQDGHDLLAKLGNIKNMLEISWVTISPESPLANQSIGEAAVRSRTGASIVGIIHGKEFYSNPQVDYTLQSGDLVAVVGNADERHAFNTLAGA